MSLRNWSESGSPELLSDVNLSASKFLYRYLSGGWSTSLVPKAQGQALVSETCCLIEDKDAEADF